MGLFSRTLSRIDEIKRSLTRETGTRQFLAVADEHRRQGRPREAIDILESGLAQNPSSVAGYVALGRLFQQTGQLDKAIDSFQSALKLDPQNLVAIRQLADVHLARGEKVEAIKRLKLFRGLSPGDREVAELIRQLDVELAPPPSPKSGLRIPVPAVPKAPAPGGSHPPGGPVGTGAPKAEPLPAAFVPENVSAPASPLPAEAIAPHVAALPDLPAPGAVSDSSEAVAGPEPERLAESSDAAPGPFQEESLPFPAAAPSLPAAATTGAGQALDTLFEGAGAEVPPEPANASTLSEPVVAPSPAAPEPPSVPAATETLAELLRAQGHLGRARAAYLELARIEPDAAKARRYAEAAAEIGVARSASVRGRLEQWVEPFARRPRPTDGDLAAAVEEVVERLAPAAALVTDLEGVPVVTVGPRHEAEAMESLSAELTAFWKNVRRARAEVGEGELRSLVLTGSAGTASVQAITSEYALLLKTVPGIPAGRIRFEAARAAEHLRPALL
ncbi:MAG TPA: tetratricopeptide repeat protein [Thermoanaerobaculia bacterium]|nr:tetratricopeptide repeat protein [Thermoanaerobaculia bacterium]